MEQRHDQVDEEASYEQAPSEANQMGGRCHFPGPQHVDRPVGPAQGPVGRATVTVFTTVRMTVLSLTWGTVTTVCWGTVLVWDTVLVTVVVRGATSMVAAMPLGR